MRREQAPALHYDLFHREETLMDKKGRFGIHGGQYIPEILMNAVTELETAYEHYKNDPDFNRELTDILNSPRAAAIAEGFRCRTAVESLCRHCGFAQTRL